MSKASSYLVPAKELVIEHEIKKSRFIASVSYASDKELALSYIKKISGIHQSATHNTYAYVIGNPNGGADVGFNDDGEVGGTAGKPILSVLQMRGIGDVVAVVTRYFGGTKLGAGGLVRAYSGTITMALDELKLKECVNMVEIKINVGYEFENAVRTVLDKAGLSIKDVAHTGEVCVTADIPENAFPSVQSEIMDTTRGNAVIKSTENF